MKSAGRIHEVPEERGYTVGELVQAARRRARPALLVGAGALVVGVAVVFLLPSQYQAEATIIVEPYRPHADLIRPAVTTLLEDRLRIAKEALLSTPNLESAVKTFDLYPKTVSRYGIAAAAEELERHLGVKPDGDSAIDLAYRTGDPSKAAPVVSAVAHGFAEANAQDRIGQATRVRDLLNDELGKVAAALDAQDRKVRAFRLAHDGELPEQVEANLEEADRATKQLDNAENWLHAVEQQRALLPANPTNPELERLATIQDDLEKQLIHAKAIYSAQYPDTIRLTREVAGIQAARRAAAVKATGAVRERRALAREAWRARREVEGLRADIRAARGRAAASAKWAGALAELDRDRDLLRKKYDSLASRKIEAEVALGLEKESALAATDVIDPPSAPTEPMAPDRPRLLWVVLALALGLAVGTGVWLESNDRSLRTPAQARASLDVPLLSVVPNLRERG